MKWQSIDGSSTKLPWAGKKTGKTDGSRQVGCQRSVLTDGRGVPIAGDGRRESA